MPEQTTTGEPGAYKESPQADPSDKTGRTPENKAGREEKYMLERAEQIRVDAT